MKLSKVRMDQLNQSLNEGVKNMETINYNNFNLTGITEELYTGEEMLDILTDIQDVVILVRNKTTTHDESQMEIPEPTDMPE